MMVAAPAHADVPQSLTAYVQGRAAAAEGAVERAAAAYGVALAGAPDNPVVALRAYREALSAGDMDLARAAARVLQEAGVAPPDTNLLAVADAVRARNWEGVNAAADRMADGPLDFIGPVVKAWVAFDRGDRDAARRLSAEGATGLARRFNTENHALLLIAGGKPDEGIAALRAILGSSGPTFDLRINAAQLLVRAGRRDAAMALIGGDDSVMTALRGKLGRGPKPSAAFGTARLVTRLGADLVRGEARPLAIMLGRAALVADPDNDRARLILADALSADGADARALALLDEVKRGAIAYPLAVANRVTVLNRAGEDERALTAAAAAAHAKGAGAADAQRYGDLLVSADRFDDAAAAYALAMERSEGAVSWTLYLQRGGALEQAGKWPEARAMLEQAVAIAPDQAVALNYLGYAQLERGENLEQAHALLERAAKLAPNNGAIADWLAIWPRRPRCSNAPRAPSPPM